MAATVSDQDNICMVCGSICKSKSGLNRHLRRHNNAAPYRCCGKMFFDRTKIIMHRCSVHGGEKQKACNICHKKFATEQQVRQHRGLTHGEKGTFRFDICGVEFKSKTSLTDHQHWHTGETAHKCQCGKTYKYASGLYRHKRDKSTRFVVSCDMLLRCSSCSVCL